MNYAALSETLIHSLAELPPDQRERILTLTINAVIAHDTSAKRDSKICLLLAQRVTYTNICKRLGVSRKTVARVARSSLKETANLPK